MTELLGLTLDRAMAVCAQMGFSPEVTYTAAVRHPVERGSYRVIRVRDGGRQLVCARAPELIEDETDEVEENR
ncbi:MAG: hypothetical protein Q4E13_10990 [Clostridia bacterium]|nr:hypothetical protein [Clostridia bacterium]